MTRDEIRAALRAARLPRLLAAVLLCELAGAVGAVPTARAVETWYPTLRKPAFNPPGWVFGPVWTALYALMGLALDLMSRAGGPSPARRVAGGCFALQLGLNALWAPLFFGRRAPGAAFAEIVALWVAVALTVAAFARLSRTAALTLLPYLAWVGFAAALNYAIWRLND